MNCVFKKFLCVIFALFCLSNLAWETDSIACDATITPPTDSSKFQALLNYYTAQYPSISTICVNSTVPYSVPTTIFVSSTATADKPIIISGLYLAPASNFTGSSLVSISGSYITLDTPLLSGASNAITITGNNNTVRYSTLTGPDTGDGTGVSKGIEISGNDNAIISNHINNYANGIYLAATAQRNYLDANYLWYPANIIPILFEIGANDNLQTIDANMVGTTWDEVEGAPVLKELLGKVDDSICTSQMGRVDMFNFDETTNIASYFRTCSTQKLNGADLIISDTKKVENGHCIFRCDIDEAGISQKIVLQTFDERRGSSIFTDKIPLKVSSGPSVFLPSSEGSGMTFHVEDDPASDPASDPGDQKSGDNNNQTEVCVGSDCNNPPASTTDDKKGQSTASALGAAAGCGGGASMVPVGAPQALWPLIMFGAAPVIAIFRRTRR